MSKFLERIDANPPHWAHEVILPWDAEKLHKYADFIRQKYWTDRGSINVFCIKGTDHPDYQGLTWHTFLHQGKRMDRNIPMLERNPEYYLGTEPKKPGMYYNSFNGLDWYIGSDGNHRSGLAKFLFFDRELTHLHGVVLNQYIFDEELLSAYRALQDEIVLQRTTGRHWSLSSATKHLSRGDTAGWKTDHFAPCFTLTLDFIEKGDIQGSPVKHDVFLAQDGWRLLHQLENARAEQHAAQAVPRGAFRRFFRRHSK